MGLILKRIFITVVYMLVAGAVMILFGLIVNLVQGLISFGFVLSRVAAALTKGLQIWFMMGAGVMLVASFYNENIWKTEHPRLFGHLLFEMKATPAKPVASPVPTPVVAPASVAVNPPTEPEKLPIPALAQAGSAGYYLSTRDGEMWLGGPDDPIGAAGLTHACPFCGGQASRGRALNWIATECAEKGQAVFPCNSCSRNITIPAAVFISGCLVGLHSRCYDSRLRQLNQHAFAFAMQKMKPMELLVRNWGEVIEAVNKGLPCKPETPAWDGLSPCPCCGKTEASAAVTLTFKCPDCGNDLIVREEALEKTISGEVECENCEYPLSIPSDVWCPVCKRNLQPDPVVRWIIGRVNGLE
jgi:predicted RNA-binding Zn-ribbon protein involved in translation (DUF1610 family)